MASSSSSIRRQQLRETLLSLEAYELPDSIQDAFSNDTLDPALVQRYQEARDLYLRRHIQSMFLAHIGSYDGHTIQEVPDQPTEEEEEETNERLTELHSQVAQAARELQQQTLELQQKHGTFCMRREELKKMIQDMEEEDVEKKDQSMDVDNNFNEGDDDDIDDDALAQEEERLAVLQQKKAQLEVKLNRMREETNSLKLKTEKTEAHVVELMQGQEPPSPAALQAEAAESQAKLQDLKKKRDFYDGVRGVMEQLNGIQILHVTQNGNTEEGAQSPSEKEETATDTDLKVDPEVIIRARALEKHDIEITLHPDPNTPDELRVADAKFLTSTVVRAPVDGTVAGQNDNSSKVLKLTIPPLDDLVKLCAMFPAGEDLRFLTRETMARIRMVEVRVVELAVLHNNVLTRIGSFQHNNDGFGGEEQEVVCSMNECITVVLRLTADCPNVPGSVYISQMVGVAGWDEETVDKIKEQVSSQDFRTPWSVIQAIQSEIARLQREEGLSLPKTPTLPVRRKKP